MTAQRWVKNSKGEYVVEAFPHKASQPVAPRHKEARQMPGKAAAIPNLGPIILTKAHKEVNIHKQNQICVTVIAVGIFPTGRKPHMLAFTKNSDDTYWITPLYGYIKNNVTLPVSQVEAWIKSLPVVNSRVMPVPDDWWPTAKKLASEVNETFTILGMPDLRSLARPKPVFHRKVS